MSARDNVTAVSELVAAANRPQLDVWDGEQGQFWREHADRFDDRVASYMPYLLTAVSPSPGLTVLDVGCGGGRVSLDIAQQTAGGAVLGVDLSSPLLVLAGERARRDGIDNVDFLQADAQVHPFPADHYDLVVSRHGVMFFAEPQEAFINLRRTLRPGGRLVALTWQPPEHNPWLAFRTAVQVAVPSTTGPGPFSLSDPNHVHDLLSASGFADVTLTGLTEPVSYGRDTDDALQLVSGQFATELAAMTPAQRTRATDALHALLDAHNGPGGVQLDSAAWLIEARRPR